MSASVDALDPRIAALLGRVWPALPHGIAHAEMLGFSWAAVSTPFVRWDGDRAIAHVGIIEQPLIVAASHCRVGFLHAVCTDPEYRGRGIARELVQEALAYCRGRTEIQMLTTVVPDFYAAFGFRQLQEHAFSWWIPRFVAPRGSPGRLLTESLNDQRVLRRLLERRAPVSERLATLEDGTILVLALLLTWGDFSRVHYHSALDVITVHEVRNGTLVLYDVIGARIPPLTALLGAIAADVDRVVTLFVPDRFGDTFHPVPWNASQALPLSDQEYIGLMARGPLVVETNEFMLPPLART